MDQKASTALFAHEQTNSKTRHTKKKHATSFFFFFQGPGKKWENTPLTANGKPVFQTVHVRTGDTVQVIAGSDKGKVGVVQKVLLKTGQVVVEGVNVKVRGEKVFFFFLLVFFFGATTLLI